MNQNSKIARVTHFGEASVKDDGQPLYELVPSFQGEGNTNQNHSTYLPEVYSEQNLGSVWTDIRDAITGGLETGAKTAAGEIIGTVAEQEAVQRAAKESAFEYILENYWKQILIGSVALTGVVVYMIARPKKKRG